MTRPRSALAAPLAALVLAGAALGAAPASAQDGGARHDIDTPFTGQRPYHLDVHGGLTWWGLGFAGGARFGIPLVQNGFVDSLDNAVYLNFGADFYYVRWQRCVPGACGEEYGPGFGVPVSLHWEFYFDDTWSAFVEIGANVFFHPGFFRGDLDFFDHPYVGAWFLGAVGGRLHLTPNIALTVRVGSPYASFGVTFLL